MWLKYKHKSSAHIDKEWSWCDLGGTAKDAEARARVDRIKAMGQ